MDILEGLNPEQRQVVADLDHHILLSAPAGTGKTNALARRVAAILLQQRAAGSQILCLTFTNRACKELKARVFSTAHEKGLDVVVKTIHSFCYTVIKEESKTNADICNDFIVYDDEDCKSVLRELLPDCGNEKSRQRLQKLQNFIETVKKYEILHDTQSAGCTQNGHNALQDVLHSEQDIRRICANYDTSADTVLEQWLLLHGAELLQNYTAVLAANHALDFADLITQAYIILQDPAILRRWREAFRYICMDEMQDTSEIEYKLISRLFPGRIVLLCGDYFQTIYEWRGSYPDVILRRFTEDYAPRRITFTTNYRATQTLLSASSACLRNLFGEAVTTVYPASGTAASAEQGQPITVKETSHVMAEARWIFHEIARLPAEERRKVCIMTRTNRCNKELWNGVRSHNERLQPAYRLPFAMIDQFQLFKRQECKDVLAFLRLVLNKHDSLSLKRILLRFASRIGKRTLETIESRSYRRLGISLCDFIDPEAQTRGDAFGLLLEALEQERIVVFDVESTGTDTTKDDIIQIAALRLDAQGKPGRTFQTYVRPMRSVGDSYYVHHISDEKLRREGKDPRAALQAFLDFSAGAVIVGHNVSYDLRILRSELRRLAMDSPDDRPYYDTLDLFRRFYPDLPNHTLSYLSSHFPIAHQPSHDAFDDILATAGLLQYAVDNHIRPDTVKRRACMSMYLPLFTPVSRIIQRLHSLSYQHRPCDLIAHVMQEGGVKAYYAASDSQEHVYGHIDRIENIRKVFRIAQEVDTPEQDARDSLIDFLQLAALSNSELDSILKKRPQIPIITIHQAKGLEFDYVFLACLQDGTFPLSRANTKQELDEEKRLFYVAITRARKRLFLSWHRSEGQRKCQISPFIAAIPETYRLQLPEASGQHAGQAQDQTQNA